MPFQHQIVAVRAGLEADRNRELAALQGILAVGGDKNPLIGLHRTHAPKTDQDQQPDERRLVQATIAGLVARWSGAESALIDAQYTREAGNTMASARVEIDGREILPVVPVGLLLFLEDELKGMLGGVINRLQSRDPAEEWHHDEGDPPGVSRSAPRETLSTTKRLVSHVAPVDPQQHPVVEWRDIDVVTGRWTWVKYSGQLSMSEIYEIHQRLSRLLAAIRSAREEANRIQVEQQHAGRAILSYVFGGLLGGAAQ